MHHRCTAAESWREGFHRSLLTWGFTLGSSSAREGSQLPARVLARPGARRRHQPRRVRNRVVRLVQRHGHHVAISSGGFATPTPEGARRVRRGRYQPRRVRNMPRTFNPWTMASVVISPGGFATSGQSPRTVQADQPALVQERLQHLVVLSSVPPPPPTARCGSTSQHSPFGSVSLKKIIGQPPLGAYSSHIRPTGSGDVHEEECVFACQEL